MACNNINRNKFTDWSKNIYITVNFIFVELRLSASECLKHPWLHISENNTSKNLETGYLRKYLARRRWKRYFNAIVAMNRMLRNGLFEKNNVGEIILKEGMFGDYGELGFFV